MILMASATQKSANELDHLLIQRLETGMGKVLGRLSAEKKRKILKSADTPELLYSILKLMPVSIEDAEKVEDAANAVRFRQRMLKAAGGALKAEDVRQLLGYKSVQAVYKAANNRRMLVVEDGGVKLFPKFQFAGGVLNPAIADVLGAAPNTSGWAILQFLVSGDEGLGKASPIALLRKGPAEAERVARFARALEA
ncbi:hypothetical protein CW354_08480 [Marinicaulis flavus]|uniref:Uncharacterized protein n=2 Tax=Hyphococcus luteus TaxID=2058213 RepID=A0A2S7K772_9PROT|nr:hypothetical protein CW354_08480 [Marinicaulis flavus]